MNFTHAIVKKPCQNIIKGITRANLGFPNYELALAQHQKYVEALESCSLNVILREADENYPDSTFVEDTAVMTRECAVITNPGALSRKGEIAAIEPIIKKYFKKIERIESPGTLEGGDVMDVDGFYYIGLSERTNRKGAQQFLDILRKYGMDGMMVGMSEMLHLKTGLSYLGNNVLMSAGEFQTNSLFADFSKIKVLHQETYAANCININGKVIVPSGFHESRKMIEIYGFETIALDMSEFQKVDGGLSCLSLRFVSEI
ncbi:MAG: N(G),N(G)-dimethylarginine dimethylaminohydrolase [Candidatus Marinimicrobia bacterium]|nr:N(G),N(G)-dimethylarginine dimethylaminohydrolase [Candidatus Neomarinimicrobiota bacterium]